MKIENNEWTDNELDLMLEIAEEQLSVCFPDKEEAIENLIKKIQNVIKKGCV